MSAGSNKVCPQRSRHRVSDALSAIAGLLVFVPAAVQGQTLQLDERMWITNGSVEAILPMGSTTYIGGWFTYVGPYTGSCNGIDPASGAVRPAWARVHGATWCTISDGNSGWFVGGDFRTVDTVQRPGLAHLRADGTLDDWAPTLPQGSSVYGLALSGSTLYVCGILGVVDGETRQLAAIDVVTGLVSGWNPSPDGEVYSMAVSGSSLYVGGTFRNIGGAPRSLLAALDTATGAALPWNPGVDEGNWVGSIAANGSTIYVANGFWRIGGRERMDLAAIDATTGNVLDWNPASEGGVEALCVSGSLVYVGGYFTTMGGANRSGLAAVDAVSGMATSWDPNVEGGHVQSLLVRGSTVYAGGWYSRIGGQDRANLAALDATTGLATPWNPLVNGNVQVLADNAATLCVCGTLNSAGGKPRRCLAALDSATGEATDWAPAADNTVTQLASIGSRIFMAGYFGTVGGLPRQRLAAVDAVTGATLDWNPQPNAPVLAVTASASVVYVGGDFTSIGGQTRLRVAALDPVSGTPTAWNPGANDYVSTLTLGGSVLYMGGRFTSVGGVERRGLAAMNANTGGVTAWAPSRSPLGSAVFALAVVGSTVYVGGDFIQLGGQPRSYLGAVSATTGLATLWNPEAGGSVKGIAADDARVCVAGEFNWIGRRSSTGLAALDAGTGLAVPWDPGQFRGMLSEIVLFDRTLYVGGTFPAAGGQARQSFAVFHPITDSIAPTARLLAPNGHETAYIGQRLPISWSATDEIAVQSIDLELSRVSATGPWEVLAAGLPNTGAYEWMITGPMAFDEAWVRVTARDYGGNVASDVSDQAFTILEPVVPTLLEQFRAAPSESGIRIEWQLADASVFRSVVLERAAAAGDVWTRVAAAIAIEGRTSRVVDADVSAGQTLWYRLSVVDRDGRAFTFGPISVRAGEPVTSFALASPAPNPTAGRSLVSFAVPQRAMVRLTLVDVQGRERAVLADGVREPGRWTAALEAADLPAGIYFLRMQSKGVVLTRRIAIVR